MLTSGLALLRSAGRQGQQLRLAPPRRLPNIRHNVNDGFRRIESTVPAISPPDQRIRYGSPTVIQATTPTLDEPKLPWWSHRKKFFKNESPRRALALRQDRANPDSRAQVSRLFGRSRSLRLPVVLMQRMMRLEEEELGTDMSRFLESPVEWRVKVNILAFRGIELSDIDQWAWILAADNDVDRLDRFLSTDSFRPLFVLLHLLRKSADFQHAKSFPALLEYIRQNHTGPDPLRDDPVLVRNAVRRSLATRYNTTMPHFMLLLKRLTHHCLHVWPAALPSVAQIVCSYMDGMRSSRIHHQARQRSLLFNYAMRLFQIPSPQHPVLNTNFNWKAMRVLLSYSTSLARPLVIDQASYRAMRRVMLGLSKSWSEKMVTARQARTWPPFRQNWDGLDERREAQDDFSRSVQAGVVARENGYVDGLSEEALDVLGGIEPDGYPMVQTRSLPERTWAGFNANQNIYLAWAARVKATRNMQEAWAQFKAHPGLGMRPNFRVYAEMFSKLSALPVAAETVLLPGDTPSIFPFPDANLSEFEKARLSPPSMRDLYSQMLNEGLRPTGVCLTTLIKNAPTMGKATAYLFDSALDLKAVEIMQPPREGQRWHPVRSHTQPHLRGKLSSIPLPVFSAYIMALCKFQPRLTDEPARAGNRGRIGFVSHAMKLIDLRLPLQLSYGRRNKAPWHAVLRTIAAPRVVVESPGFDDPELNDLLALRLFVRHYKPVEAAMGTDIALFDALCRVTQKAAAAMARRHTGGYQGYWAEVSGLRTSPGSGFENDLRVAHDLMKHSFRTLTLPVDRGGHTLKLPSLLHGITPAHLHLYLRALGYLHDTDEMVFAMRWSLDAWKALPDVLEDAKDPEHKHHYLMAQALTFFRAYAEDVVPGQVMRELEEKVLELRDEADGTWAWPTQEAAEVYKNYDERAGTQEFWRAVEGVRTERRGQIWRAMEAKTMKPGKERWEDGQSSWDL